MAPGRLYRDYSIEDNEETLHFQVPSRCTPSLKQAWERELSETPRTVTLDHPSSPRTHPSSARTVIPDGRPDYRPDGKMEHDGTRLCGDGASSHDGYGDYEPGLARTNDGRVISPPVDGHTEPILDHGQIDMHDLDTALPAIPHDINKNTYVNKTRALSPSITSTSEFSSSGGSTGAAPAPPGKVPEFFSQAVFQTVLHIPTIAHQLLRFAQSRLCGENMDFLARVNRYHALMEEVAKAISEIHKDFISNSSATQLNLPESVLFKVNNEMRYALSSGLPMLENIFLHAQANIERLVYTDIYPKFVRHQMSVSAAKALGGDRTRYAGLGDCFVLTDPAKADNPLVYVSDGFVKVTGYTRSEIIPRNCRFLQSRHTDRAAVRRLKTAIEKREQSVELLLNHREDGEPFWNLLYMTPLFDGHGTLVFFLAGQINCSTTVHSGADVLQILAQSKDVEETATSGVASSQRQQQYGKPSRRSILSAFRSNSRANIQQGAPGMENNLLNKIEEKPLEDQMSSFYTAYSHVSHTYPSYLNLGTGRANTYCSIS